MLSAVIIFIFIASMIIVYHCLSPDKKAFIRRIGHTLFADWFELPDEEKTVKRRKKFRKPKQHTQKETIPEQSHQEDMSWNRKN
ncbi:MAG: hypothetical protein E7496_05575 [Ruminococcus sp.]|nr:hypothetical protein [Ruminococcus sp.]